MFIEFMQTHMRSIATLANYLYQKILPPMCLLCGSLAHAYNLCRGCYEELPILADNCPQCARFLVAEPSNRLVCGQCQKNSPPYENTFAAFPYQMPIIYFIKALKFQQQLSMSKLFGEILSEKILNQWYIKQPLPELIIPVPLHTDRLTERGFNQTLEIARIIKKITKIPIDRDIKRIKPTLPQSGLNARKRQTNMARAFKTSRNYDGLTVAVLDDVITTGHTVNALCKIIKQQGAHTIHVWCCARRG